MFTFISLAVKISISIIITYLLIIFNVDKKKDEIQNKNLLIFTLFFSSLLSFFYILSKSTIDFNITAGILSSCILFALYVYFNVGNIKNYFILFSICLFISIGYILSSLLIFSVYMLLDKYSNDVLEYFKSSFDDETDEIENVDLDK